MGLVRLLINSFLFAVWINSCEEKLVNLDQKNGYKYLLIYKNM